MRSWRYRIGVGLSVVGRGLLDAGMVLLDFAVVVEPELRPKPIEFVWDERASVQRAVMDRLGSRRKPN